MMKTRLLFLLTLSVVCTLAFGQKKFSKITAADFATPKEAADSSVDAVRIYDIGETRFNATSTGFTLDTYVKVRIHILTEKGREYANREIVYRCNDKKPTSENDAVKGVEACSYNLVDGKVVKTAMEGKYEFKEKVNDYYYRLKFTIPEVKVGSIIEYKYEVSSPRCTEIPTWMIQHKEPVRYSYYCITIPEWFYYHVEGHGYAPIRHKQSSATLTVPTKSGAAIIMANKYVIEAENLRPFEKENLIYGQDDYAQRMDFELMNVRIPGQSYQSFTKSWKEVRYYLEEKADYLLHLKIKNPYADEMASLGLDGKTASQKASILFAFLKKKLKWDGKYALVSKNPLKAIKEGKGSNADLNFIYMAMLRDAGVTATPLLLRWRSHGRLPITYASIDKLDTFIVAFTDDNGALLFADTSADYGDINILPANLMAEGVLYNPDIAAKSSAAPTRGEIYDLSQIRGNTTTTRLNSILSPDGKINGQRINNHVGFNSLIYKENYHEVADSMALVEKIEKELGCKLGSFKVKNVEGVGRAVEERMRFTKDAVVDGDRIYFNPLVFPDEKKNWFTKPERVLPVEFPACQTTTITSVVTIPEGYELEEMPKNQIVRLEGYLAGVISFEMQDRNLITKYQNLMESTFIPAEKYDDLRKYWSDLLKVNSMMVGVKKK